VPPRHFRALLCSPRPPSPLTHAQHGGFPLPSSAVRVRGDDLRSPSGVCSTQLGNAFTEGIESAVVVERVGVGTTDLVGDRRILCVQLVERLLTGSKCRCHTGDCPEFCYRWPQSELVGAMTAAFTGNLVSLHSRCSTSGPGEGRRACRPLRPIAPWSPTYTVDQVRAGGN